MKKEIKRNYKEIAKKNIFIKNAAEIRAICLKENVDIGVGLDMYVTNHKIDRAKHEDEYQEFRELCRENSLRNIVEELKK